MDEMKVAMHPCTTENEKRVKGIEYVAVRSDM
jgi:hypothetical protein